MVHLREADADDALLISRIIAASWRSAYRGLIDEATRPVCRMNTGCPPCAHG